MSLLLMPELQVGVAEQRNQWQQSQMVFQSANFATSMPCMRGVHCCWAERTMLEECSDITSPPSPPVMYPHQQQQQQQQEQQQHGSSSSNNAAAGTTATRQQQQQRNSKSDAAAAAASPGPLK
ncbi:hypothetical protein Efla_007757 [Eimeria flavescens]